MITGSHDILTTPTMTEHFATDFPSATTHILKDAAHALHWEQTGAFMECVLDALER
jgi:pimeloyl-ACP methyl ester carboxylesterase